MRLRFLPVIFLFSVYFICTQSWAQEMSVPTADFSGRLVFRQYGNEQNSSVFRRFIALIPQDLIKQDFFEKKAPASYYNILPADVVLNPRTFTAMIEPPMPGFNFRKVPAGNYWFCKFNDSDEIDIKKLSSYSEFMISGCQYADIRGKNDIYQEYYSDEFGLWIDDVADISPPPPPPPSPKNGDGSCKAP